MKNKTAVQGARAGLRSLRHPKPNEKSMPWRAVLVACALLLVVAAIPFFHSRKDSSTQTSPKPQSIAETVKKTRQPDTLVELLALAPEQIDQCDVERMNLICAEGLRGAEDLNLNRCLAILDSWTRHVESETKRNYHRFQENPKEYDNSEAYYRMIMLATVLQQDFGAHYSPDRAAPQLRGEWEPNDKFYGNSKDVFIHGLLGTNNVGTCSSLPVLFVVVAQRLGYPVELAAAKGHLYVRYEEEDRHLNVEATSQGMNTYPDEHYRNWPHPVSEDEARTYGFLRPMSKREMLGAFLTIRAGCLTSMKRFDDAAGTWAQAARFLAPTPVLAKLVERAQKRAGNERDADRWDTLWQNVERLWMPDGPKAAHYRNRKVQVQLFMGQSTDMPAIERAVNELSEELAAEFKRMGLDPDARLLAAAQPRQQSAVEGTRSSVGDPDGPLALVPELTRVSIPEECVPPEYRQSIPPALQERLRGLIKPEEITSEMWFFYMEEVNQRNREAMDLLTNPQPLLGKVRAEWLPPEYRQSMPADLRMQLTHLRDRERVQQAIRQYQTVEKARQSAHDLQRQNEALLRAGSPPVSIQIVPTQKRAQ